MCIRDRNKWLDFQASAFFWSQFTSLCRAFQLMLFQPAVSLLFLSYPFCSLSLHSIGGAWRQTNGRLILIDAIGSVKSEEIVEFSFVIPRTNTVYCKKTNSFHSLRSFSFCVARGRKLDTWAYVWSWLMHRLFHYSHSMAWNGTQCIERHIHKTPVLDFV